MDDVFFIHGTQAARLRRLSMHNFKHAQFQHNQQTTHSLTRREHHFGSFPLPHPVV